MNLYDFLLIAALAVALGLAIRAILRNRRQGKSSCGCDCGHCMAKCDRREESSTNAPPDASRGSRSPRA